MLSSINTVTFITVKHNKVFNNITNKCYMFLSITIVRHSNIFMFTYVLYNVF